MDLEEWKEILPIQDLYWIERLTPQQIYTFQYRTNDGKKVADLSLD